MDSNPDGGAQPRRPSGDVKNPDSRGRTGVRTAFRVGRYTLVIDTPTRRAAIPGILLRQKSEKRHPVLGISRNERMGQQRLDSDNV
jgi:hypothetical protein